MGIFSKILSGGAGELIEKIGSTVDKFVTTGAEKEQMKQEMFKLVQEHEAKMESEITARQLSEDTSVSERWKADSMSDSWMSKNSRPLTLLSLLAFLYLIILSDSISAIPFQVAPNYIDLLQILLTTVVVAYFGGRSWEKMGKIKSK